LLTPKDLAKIGIAGTTNPNPIATKNPAKIVTRTSRGNSRNSFSLTFRPLPLRVLLNNRHECVTELP
jgi:hypothetical protein